MVRTCQILRVHSPVQELCYQLSGRCVLFIRDNQTYNGLTACATPRSVSHEVGVGKGRLMYSYTGECTYLTALSPFPSNRSCSIDTSKLRLSLLSNWPPRLDEAGLGVSILLNRCCTQPDQRPQHVQLPLSHLEVWLQGTLPYR